MTSRPWVRVMLASLLLLAVYGALSLLDDPHGALGADTGGKLATLRVMSDRGTLDPDVGYWAAREDPRGSLHPLYYTRRVDGHWVQATTLPMLDVALPLYDLGGLRAVLLLPMLGAMLTALGARAFARRLGRGGGGDGWVVFWTVGLATPVAVYALDFWEHALGLGLVTWALVLTYDVCERRARWPVALGAGVLFGAAAALRTEALVYFAVGGLAVLVAWWLRDRAWRDGLIEGAAMGMGAFLALAANQLLEVVTLGSALRSGRAASTAAGAGSGAGGRVREAVTTAVGVNGVSPSTEVVLGVLLVALLGFGALLLGDRHRRGYGVVCLVFAGAIYVARLGAGLGYLPGALTASPLAAVGIVAGWRSRSWRWPLVVAVAALPLVWIAQYSGNMRPQWGGRYVLVSGVLLAIVGLLGVLPDRRVLIPVLVIAVAVTAWGVANLSVRSHRIADGMSALVARHDAALISTEAHVLREGGAFYEPQRHWLTATDTAQLHRAARIVAGAGDDELAVLTSDPGGLPVRLAGFAQAGTAHVVIRPGEHLAVVRYRRS